MTDRIIAIDPGRQGGIACLIDGVVSVWSLPETEGDVLDLLRSVIGDGATVLVEDVGGYVGRPQPGSSMFKFGRGVGFLLGCCMALGARVLMVRPQKWQTRLGIGTKGTRTGREWKAALKAEAQRRFPGLRVTLSTADALLMLEHARRAQP